MGRGRRISSQPLQPILHPTPPNPTPSHPPAQSATSHTPPNHPPHPPGVHQQHRGVVPPVADDPTDALVDRLHAQVLVVPPPSCSTSSSTAASGTTRSCAPSCQACCHGGCSSCSSPCCPCCRRRLLRCCCSCCCRSPVHESHPLLKLRVCWVWVGQPYHYHTPAWGRQHAGGSARPTNQHSSAQSAVRGQ